MKVIVISATVNDNCKLKLHLTLSYYNLLYREYGNEKKSIINPDKNTVGVIFMEDYGCTLVVKC